MFWSRSGLPKAEVSRRGREARCWQRLQRGRRGCIGPWDPGWPCPLYQSVIWIICGETDVETGFWSSSQCWAFPQSRFRGEAIWGDCMLGLWTPGDFLQERGSDAARQRGLHYVPQRVSMPWLRPNLVFTQSAGSTFQAAIAGYTLLPVLRRKGLQPARRAFPNSASF